MRWLPGNGQRRFGTSKMSSSPGRLTKRADSAGMLTERVLRRHMRRSWSRVRTLPERLEPRGVTVRVLEGLERVLVAFDLRTELTFDGRGIADSEPALQVVPRRLLDCRAQPG